MRYSEFEIVLQEVPGEVTLCFTITGCKLACDGCHSPYLWKDGSGEELNSVVFNNLIDRYENLISCVLFMGGEWHKEELLVFLRIARERGLKTCLYTGLEDVEDDIKHNLDYLKIGPWNKALGGLKSIETNQRFINVKTGENLNYVFNKKKEA
jgi:anaerobic ribonucleoside-triphosphate reductase activating protein